MIKIRRITAGDCGRTVCGTPCNEMHHLLCYDSYHTVRSEIMFYYTVKISSQGGEADRIVTGTLDIQFIFKEERYAE